MTRVPKHRPRRLREADLPSVPVFKPNAPVKPPEPVKLASDVDDPEHEAIKKMLIAAYT